MVVSRNEFPTLGKNSFSGFRIGREFELFVEHFFVVVLLVVEEPFGRREVVVVGVVIAG